MKRRGAEGLVAKELRAIDEIFDDEGLVDRSR